MKAYSTVFFVASYITSVKGAFSSDPKATPKLVNVIPDMVQPRAINPTDAGQIGINPVDPITHYITKNTKYLTDLGSTTSWIGENPMYISIITSTITDSAGATETATITQGVAVEENTSGGLDIIWSPAVQERLEKIAKEVTPCEKTKRDDAEKGCGSACGATEFSQRVSQDEELKKIFHGNFNGQVWEVIDRQGDQDPSKAIMFVDKDRAEEFTELYRNGHGEVVDCLTGDLGLATFSLLGLAYVIVVDTGVLPPVNIPPESIQTVTPTQDAPDNPDPTEPPEDDDPTTTKTNPTTTTATTTSDPATSTTERADCPTEVPTCPEGCQPLMRDNEDQITQWFCSEGEFKDCQCLPMVYYDADPIDTERLSSTHDILESIPEDVHILKYKETESGELIQEAKKLRVLLVGDSRVVGITNDGSKSAHGYRKALFDNCLRNDMVFAGTEGEGDRTYDYYAAWPNQTVEYISENIEDSLKQGPNIILLDAGSTDMRNSENDPKDSAKRVGDLVDKMLDSTNATILVGMIMSPCQHDSSFSEERKRTEEYRNHLADIALMRYADYKRVLAADFSTFDSDKLTEDCIYPTEDGHNTLGSYWYDFIMQIPQGWVQRAYGDDAHPFLPPDDDDDEDPEPEPEPEKLCNTKEDFPKEPISDPQTILDLITPFCAQVAPKIDEWVKLGQGHTLTPTADGTQAAIFIEWINDCEREDNSQWTKLKEFIECRQALMNIWDDCKGSNGGLGGYINDRPRCHRFRINIGYE